MCVPRIWKPFASIQLISACHAVFWMDCFIAWTAVYLVMQQTFVTVQIFYWVSSPLLVYSAWKWILGYCVWHNVLYFFFTLSVWNRGLLKSTFVKSLEMEENERAFFFLAKILWVIQNVLEHLNQLNLFIMTDTDWTSAWSSPHLNAHGRGNHCRIY